MSTYLISLVQDNSPLNRYRQRDKERHIQRQRDSVTDWPWDDLDNAVNLLISGWSCHAAGEDQVDRINQTRQRLRQVGRLKDTQSRPQGSLTATNRWTDRHTDRQTRRDLDRVRAVNRNPDLYSYMSVNATIHTNIQTDERQRLGKVGHLEHNETGKERGRQRHRSIEAGRQNHHRCSKLWTQDLQTGWRTNK